MTANPPNLPPTFPAPWAVEWGQHIQYGLYMFLELQGIRQCFRWIQPGSFLMGSPENEVDREEDEQQHRVILTKGYWLADTACTQAFWQAVMANNPSSFNEDEKNPVENVSWGDVQEFILALNHRVPELYARLPIEAEWEYACRAGKDTPFSFGDNINPEQVNYDGDFPYAGGAKGLDRRKTVPVKSLPANPWGIYEMHGNVREWCADWYGDYLGGEVLDPVGPPTGGSRVLRGGAWGSFAQYCRSACRSYDQPGSRNFSIGFRLALGQ